MNTYTSKVAGSKSIRGQQECDCVGAYNAMRRAFNIGEVEGKRSKLTDVLARFEVIKRQTSVAVCCQLTNGSERKTGNSVKCNVTAV